MPPAPQRKEVGAFTESFTVAQRGSVCGTLSCSHRDHCDSDCITHDRGSHSGQEAASLVAMTSLPADSAHVFNTVFLTPQCVAASPRSLRHCNPSHESEPRRRE